MTESTPQDESSFRHGIKRKPVVIKKPASAAVVAKPSQPIKVSGQNASVAAPLKLSKSSGPKVMRKPTEPRIGNPDFSSSIISHKERPHMRKRTHVSMGQLIFFDASIALIALSFMILVIVRL
jgi:hypothetical protein